MDVADTGLQLDLRGYMKILWRRKWIFLAVLILVPAAAYLVSSRAHKVYLASTLVQVGPTAIDVTNGTAGPTQQYIAIAARLIQTTGVAKAAAHDLGLRSSSAGAVLAATSVTTDPNTGFLTISATGDSPQRAAKTANAVAAAVNTSRARRAVRDLNIENAALQAQIAALPATAVTARRQLVNQSERLQSERAAQGTNAQVIEPAVPSSAPISPHPVRSTMLAALLAFLLGLGLVAIAESIDRRVRDPEELAGLVGLPLLASVPRRAFKGGLDSWTIEAFRSLRASLVFFNVDRDMKSIVIASARPGEGKTLVATNLARAYAYAGSDVILVDADLRRPMVASRLDLTSGPGLAGVLSGQAPLTECLAQISVRGRETGQLILLPAGDVPPNPAELLSSDRMRRLIDELSGMCDVVIFDTSPLLAVSDALPLLDRVSGTLLVARTGEIRRDDAVRIGRLLHAARSTSLGVVATGVKGRTSNMAEYAGYKPSMDTADSPNGVPATQPGILAFTGQRRR